MSRLTVISPAYYDSLSPTLYLSDSCERLGLNLHLFGHGEPWPWLVDAKVIRLAQEIEKIDSEYFLMTDAGDSFILDDEETIMMKFHASGASVLVSAEKKCWPNPSLANHYAQVMSPWRYLNSGGYIGSKAALLSLLRAMRDCPRPSWMQAQRSRDWMNDQFLMSLLFVAGYPIQLDTHCKIFQCMGDSEHWEFEWRDGRLWNERMTCYPSILHFNGHAPGIEEAYGRRFALDAACQ